MIDSISSLLECLNESLLSLERQSTVISYDVRCFEHANSYCDMFLALSNLYSTIECMHVEIKHIVDTYNRLIPIKYLTLVNDFGDTIKS